MVTRSSARSNNTSNGEWWNRQVTLRECLQFCDKRDLVLASDNLRDSLPLGSKATGKQFFSRVEDLRNDLAHSQPTIAGTVPWTQLLPVVEKVEALLHLSDDLIEARAGNGPFAKQPFW